MSFDTLFANCILAPFTPVAPGGAQLAGWLLLSKWHDQVFERVVLGHVFECAVRQNPRNNQTLPSVIQAHKTLANNLDAGRGFGRHWPALLDDIVVREAVRRFASENEVEADEIAVPPEKPNATDPKKRTRAAYIRLSVFAGHTRRLSLLTETLGNIAGIQGELDHRWVQEFGKEIDQGSGPLLPWALLWRLQPLSVRGLKVSISQCRLPRAELSAWQGEGGGSKPTYVYLRWLVAELNARMGGTPGWKPIREIFVSWEDSPPDPNSPRKRRHKPETKDLTMGSSRPPAALSPAAPPDGVDDCWTEEAIREQARRALDAHLDSRLVAHFLRCENDCFEQYNAERQAFEEEWPEELWSPETLSPSEPRPALSPQPAIGPPRNRTAQEVALAPVLILRARVDELGLEEAAFAGPTRIPSGAPWKLDILWGDGSDVPGASLAPTINDLAKVVLGSGVTVGQVREFRLAGRVGGKVYLLGHPTQGLLARAKAALMGRDASRSQKLESIPMLPIKQAGELQIILLMVLDVSARDVQALRSTAPSLGCVPVIAEELTGDTPRFLLTCPAIGAVHVE